MSTFQQKVSKKSAKSHLASAEATVQRIEHFINTGE
jgi:hypothetical protein